MIKVSIIFGTRPEVIKLATVIKAFKEKKNVQLDVCFTGQHKEMVLPLLQLFDIKVDYALDVMQPDQTLSGLSASSLITIDTYLKSVKPDIVFVQGDTTTAMCAAMTAFYNKIKVAHIEAGLRTHDIMSPFPEEFNRQVISKVANIHFAPTMAAAENLAKENISSAKIIVTGNTVIDALLFTRKKFEANNELYLKRYPWSDNGNKMILITGHRRESFGKGFENICYAIKELSEKYPEYNFVYPVHLNPNVQEPVKRILGKLENVFLIPPVDYIEFTNLMHFSYFILTDSGGIQEEAPSLGKPVLVMRDSTEREEAIRSGSAKLVGTTKEGIVQNVTMLIEDESLYYKMSGGINPFGDGRASSRIVDQTLLFFK